MNAPVTRRDAVLGFAAAATSFAVPSILRAQSAGPLPAAATSFAVPSILRAQSAGRLVVVGGGFGGAACARALKRAQANLQVILIEPSTVFTSCPFSNEVIAGLRDIEAQQFGYDRLGAEGVTGISQAVTTIEPQ